MKNLTADEFLTQTFRDTENKFLEQAKKIRTITIPHEFGADIWVPKDEYDKLEEYKYDTKNITIPLLKEKIAVLEQVIKLNNITLPEEK